MTEPITVLEGLGYVELVANMASDLTVVNAARVSYGKQSNTLTERDVKLIGFLMQRGHGSPFEHSVFQFRIKAPWFVVKMVQRHRIASFNEQSGRWSELEPEFYAPEPEIAEASEFAYGQYKAMIARGVAKERARIALPLGIMTTFWFTVNARSLMNFIELRSGEAAQDEIQQYSRAMESFFQVCMPVTWDAFTRNGMVAP